jgi:hypothetical protein
MILTSDFTRVATSVSVSDTDLYHDLQGQTGYFSAKVSPLRKVTLLVNPKRDQFERFLWENDKVLGLHNLENNDRIYWPEAPSARHSDLMYVLTGEVVNRTSDPWDFGEGQVEDNEFTGHLFFDMKRR